MARMARRGRGEGGVLGMGAGNYARFAIFSGAHERREGDSATGNEVEERRVVPDLARVRGTWARPQRHILPRRGAGFQQQSRHA